MELNGALLNGSISADHRFVKIVYGKCLPGPDKKIHVGPLEPNNRTVDKATITLATDKLIISSSAVAEIRWISNSRGADEDPDGALVAGNRRFHFYDDAGQLCLLNDTGATSQWCHTIDPYSRHLRAGPSLGVNVRETPEGILVVTNWFGAFLLDKETGFAKWHITYSNSDFIPSILDAGDRWIFLPQQLEETSAP